MVLLDTCALRIGYAFAGCSGEFCALVVQAKLTLLQNDFLLTGRDKPE
jgi:hypothetical protein